MPNWRSLPDEILSTVFEQVLATWESSSDHDFSSLGQSLKSITATCRTWREVALSTPRLWRNIYNGDLGDVDWYTPEDEEPEDNPPSPLLSSVEWVKQIDLGAFYYPPEITLRRSGSLPLHLYAEKPYGLCELLVQLSEINATKRVQAIELRDLCRKMPQYEDDFDFNQSDFLHCPNLRAVSLRGLGTALFADLYDMLMCHPSIEYLSMSNIWWAWGDMEARDVPVSMPKLHTLLISHHQHSAFVKTFDSLRMPVLERLSLEKKYNDDGSIPSLGVLTVHESLATLKEIVLAGAFTTGDILHILEKTPNLQILHIRNGIYDDFEDLFDKLGHHPWLSPTICPKLKHLVVQHCPVSPHSIMAMVESRQQEMPISIITSAAREWERWPHEALERLGTTVRIEHWTPTDMSSPWLSE